MRRSMFTAVVYLATCALSACATEPNIKRSEDGPLDTPPPHGYALTFTAGKPFTDGLEILHLDEGTIVTLEGVRFEAPSCLQPLGAKVVGPVRPYASIDVLRSWPLAPATLRREFGDAEVVDLVGTVLKAENDPDEYGWELLIGMRSECVGTVTRKAILLDYTADGSRYSLRIPGELEFRPA